MFLRRTNRKKDGKDHRYFSVVENRRLSSGKTVQRTVLYLGEINDSQEAAWRKTLDVFDEKDQRSRTLSLFPEDREIPSDALDSLQLKVSGLELRAAAAIRQLLVGMPGVAGSGIGGILAPTVAQGPRGGRLGEGVAAAGGEPVDRARQRISSAPPLVFQ